MAGNPIGGIIESLPMETMFWGPLDAAIKAQTAASEAYVEFLEKVGMVNGETRMIRFNYKALEQNQDGSAGSTSEKTIDVPLLAVVPQPAFGVDEVNITLDVEVSTSDTSKTTNSASVTASASGGFLWWKASFKGTYSHSSERTRKTDTRAKYHVDMKATSKPNPEGMARLLDHITNAATTPIDKANAPAIAAPASGGGGDTTSV
jgi:hypothetical protein